VRYATDEVYGEENLFRYTEAYVAPGALAPLGITNLAELNVYRGALDAETLQPTGNAHILVSGIPLSLAVHRHMNRKDTKVTARINVDWDFAENMMLYANATSGYRSGGYNLVFFSATETYDPEELVAYELGFKGQHLDNTLQIFASAYLYDYSNIHTFGAELSATGGTTTSVLEADGAKIMGVEAEVMYLLTDSLTLGGNLSFTPSEYTEDTFLSNTADFRVPNSLFSAVDINYNLKGNQVLNVPDYKGSMFAMYSVPLGENGNIELLANYSWISKVYHTPFQDEKDSTPGYDRIDLRGTWTSADEAWVVAGYVNNVMDKIGVRQLEAHGEDQGFRRTGQLTEPRMAGIEVSYKFGTN
jgi:iron complex outermembrane receptor protein